MSRPSLPGAFDLGGRTALITGAAGTLGRQHALALLEIGARVVITDVDEAQLDEARAEIESVGHGGVLAAEVMDVGDEESIISVADQMEAGGGIQILLNNAAVDAKAKDDQSLAGNRFESFPVERWNQEVAVGLTGAFLCSREFGTRMAAHGGGVILNIASDLSVIAPDQRLYRLDSPPPEGQPVKPVTYSVVKAGIVGLTMYLATYWPERGVRVNALSPGGVRAGQDDGFVERLETRIPMGRMAQPGEYRSVVQFLCSDASDYLTGQNVVMDGGRSVW